MALSDAQKRKIINLVAQGEAKNVKLVFHSPEVRDGLKKILGEREGDRAYDLLRSLTTAAEKNDWLEPYQRTISMMSGMPAAGLSTVTWE